MMELKMNSRGKQITANLLLGVLGISMAVGVTELALRLFYPQNTLERAIALTPNYYRRSDLIEFELQKNYSGQVWSQETNGTYSVHTNSQGLREAQDVLPKQAGVYRILTIGDSFTFGYSVNDGQEWPVLLESCLKQHDSATLKFEVVNAGYASGPAPDSHYLFLKELAPQYDPDMVLAGYYVGNDFADLTETLWPEQANGLPLRVESTLNEVDDSGRLHNRELGPRYQYPILRNSQLFQLLVESSTSRLKRLIR
jgi:hypothetical protein